MLGKLRELVEKIIRKFRQMGMPEEQYRAEQLRDVINTAFKQAADKAKANDIRTRQTEGKPLEDGNTLTNEKGDVVARVDEDYSLRYSQRTYHDWTDEHGNEHKGTRTTLEEYFKENGFAAKDTKRMLDNMDYWYDLTNKVANFVDEDGNFRYPEFHRWSQSRPLYRQYEGNVVRAVSTLVSNGEYPLNFELSTDCIKREAYTQILNEMLSIDGNFWNKLTPQNIMDIQNIQKSYGIEVACPLCFVEAKRLNLMKWANNIVKKWNQAVEEVTGSKRTSEFGFGKGTFVPDAPISDGEAAQNSDVVRQINEVHKLLNSREGILPDDMKTMQENAEAVEKLLQQWCEDYAQEHGSMEGFTLTMAQEGELEKLRNKNMRNSVQKMVKLIAGHPELRHRLKVEDLVGSKGLMAMRSQDNSAYAKMFSVIRAANGTGTPKIVQDAQPYDGEILLASDSKFAKADKIGGARLFSFSDFDITKVFDIMQIFADCEARNAKVQSYSKEVPYIVIFGKSGVKINMSMLPEARPQTDELAAYRKAKNKDERNAALHKIHEYAGLDRDANGRIIGLQLSKSHSVPQEFAEAIFHDPAYNANCGAVMVGISVNHALYSMAQPYIRQVIPFHLSGMPIAARKKSDCIYYHDFTDEQNTGILLDGKRVKLLDAKGKSRNANVEGDFEFYEGEDQPGWDIREKCREYVKWCKDNGCLPRFPWAVNSQGYIDWCEKEGYTPDSQIIEMMDAHTTDGVYDEYYKVITDFTAYQPVFDEQGNMVGERAAPHKPVTTNFDVSEETMGKAFGVDKKGNLVDSDSMLARRERTIANTDRFKKEIAQKSVALLQGHAKVGELLNDGGQEFDSHSDSDKYLEEHVQRFSLKGENKKTTFGERNDADSHNSSSEGLALEGNGRLSDGTLTDSKVDTKLMKNSENVLRDIRLIQNQGGFKDKISDVRDAVRAVGKRLHMQKSQSSLSYYRELAEGEIYESNFIAGDRAINLRVSTHPAFADNMGKSDADIKVSIVIYKDGEHRATKPHDGYTEYTFYPDEIAPRDAANAILQGVKSLIETGEFVDPTGKAKPMEYPHIDDNNELRYSLKEQGEEKPVREGGVLAKAEAVADELLRRRKYGRPGGILEQAEAIASKLREEREGGQRYSLRNPFGGNSGYVGYSMSKRAAKAREDGRYPKTDFRKEYGVSPKSFDALVDAGIIDNSEWHHTSVYGNKTTFYGWKGLSGYIYAANKKEIDKMVKGYKPMTRDELSDMVMNHNPYKRQSTSEQFSNRMNEVDRWQRREEHNLDFDYEFKNSDEEQAERWDKLQGIWAEAKKRKDAVRAEFPEDAHIEEMNEMHDQWRLEQYNKFNDQKGAFSQELRDYFEDKKKDLFDDELRKAGIMKGDKQWSRPEFADIYNDNKAEIESMIEDLKLDDIENPYSLEEANIPGPAYRQDYDEVREKESAEKNAVDRKARRKDFKEAHPISYERDEIIRNEKKAIEEKYAPLYDEVLKKHPEEQKRREEEIERQRKYGEWEDSPELQQQTRDALTRNAIADYFEQKAAEREEAEDEANGQRFSLRTEPAPRVTKKGYAVFIAKTDRNGKVIKIVPKMLSNDPGAPAFTWLNADTGYLKRDADGKPLQNTIGRAAVSINGRQSGGKKTNKLSWRPGKHLALYPNASQFMNGDGTIDSNVIFFEVEYAADPELHKKYQTEAWGYGMKANGEYDNTLGGIPYIPKDSYYVYRTNGIADGATPMIITGAYKIGRALTDAEARSLNEANGGKWVPRRGGELTAEGLKAMGLDEAGLKELTGKFDLNAIAEHHDESAEAQVLPGYVLRPINFDSPKLKHAIEENGQNVED